MEQDATQGATEKVESGADTDGAETAGDTNGSSVPSTLAGALATTPSPTSTAKPTKMVPQEKVNKIAAKAREDGANSVLKDIYSRYGIESEEEFEQLLTAGRTIKPHPKDKVASELELKLAEKDRQIAELKQRDQVAAIERACFPLLSDTHKPALALQAIIEETGYRPKVNEQGNVVVVDGDGDEVDMTVQHWIKTGRARIRYMIKSTVEPAVTVAKTVKTKAEAEAEQRQEEARGADPRHRQREITKILQSAALKTSSH